MAVLVSLDHTDDWVRGFGATVEELDTWEQDALRGVAMEILAVIEESNGDYVEESR
jgi:hypothetical protein